MSPVEGAEAPTWGTTKAGTEFHCKDLPSMSEESRAALESIIDHTASLPPEELKKYEDPRRSIVEARQAAPTDNPDPEEERQ